MERRCAKNSIEKTGCLQMDGKEKIDFVRLDSLKLLGFEGEMIFSWSKCAELERGCELGFRIERKLSKPNSFGDKCIFLSSWVHHCLQFTDSCGLYCELCSQQWYMVHGRPETLGTHWQLHDSYLHEVDLLSRFYICIIGGESDSGKTWISYFSKLVAVWTRILFDFFTVGFGSWAVADTMTESSCCFLECNRDSEHRFLHNCLL